MNQFKNTVNCFLSYVIAIWLLPALCHGQDVITNVDFVWQSDTEKVIITYSLNLSSGSIANVRVSMSLDGGRTFRRLNNVTGDTGTVRTSGNKQIVFDIFSELGKEEISGEVQFKVEGEYDATPLPLIRSYGSKTREEFESMIRSNDNQGFESMIAKAQGDEKELIKNTLVRYTRHVDRKLRINATEIIKYLEASTPKP